MNAGPRTRAGIAPVELAAWRDELVGAGIVGTSRRPLPSAPASLGVVEGSNRTSEARLLEFAALDDVMTRAESSAAPAPLGPAPSEVRPAAPVSAVAVVESCLREGRTGDLPKAAVVRLVGTWLDAADRRGTVVPPRLLPDVLHVETNAWKLAALPGLGERGAWLIDVSGRAPKRAGPLRATDRISLLREVLPDEAGRAVAGCSPDDTGAILGVLRAVWPTLEPTKRARLVAMVPTGGLPSAEGTSAIDPDAQAFVEDRLDDPASEVRSNARLVLARLPGSHYAARMAQRLRALVRVEQEPPGRGRIALRRPTVDDGAERDGLPPATGARGPDLGTWVARIIECAPLSVWTEVIPGGVDEVAPRVYDALGDQHRRSLLTAVQHQYAVPWARALLAHGAVSTLIRVLPAEEREQMVARRLRARLGTSYDPSIELAAVPEPWSHELGELVLEFAVPAVPVTTARRTSRSSRSRGAGPRWLDASNRLASQLPTSVEPRMRELVACDREDEAFAGLRASLVAELRVRELTASIDEVFA